MSGLALLAAFLGRPVAGLRLLTLAATGLVLVDPFLIHSLGFGLSCGASAGILLLAGPLSRRLPGPRALREPLAVTAAAQVGVAPIALPAFGHLPLAALPANLAAAPAAAALSLWGLGSGLVGGLLGGGAGSGGGGPAALLQGPTAALAGWIRVVAHLAARCPLMIGPRAGALIVGAALLWWRSGFGADRALPGERHLRGEVDLQSDGVVEGQETGPGDQQGGGDGGVEEVELEAAALAGRAQQPDVPLHLGHDQQHLHRDEAAPDPGQ
jgi:predicted membrane metal-binding protein